MSEDYIHIDRWMSRDLGLSGNELMVYAMIYGFTKSTCNEFSGSLTYISDWLNITRRSAINVLNKLVEQGLITKRTEGQNGNQVVRYRSVYLRPEDVLTPEQSSSVPLNNFHQTSEENSPPVKKVHQTSEKSSLVPVKKVHQTSEKSSPNNIIYNINDNLKDNINTYVGATKTFILLPTNTKDEYSVTEDFVAEMKDLYPNADVEQELRKMRGWLIGNPTRRKTAKGMKRFITSWLGNAQNSGRKPVRTYSGYSSPVYDYTEQERAFAESEMPF